MIRSVRQSFAAGELAPELHMRSDLVAYQKGAALLRNMIVRRTGSAMKRPGTDALGAGAFGAEGATLRVFPFYYDSSKSYVLLVTAGKARVFEASPLFRHVAAGESSDDIDMDGWTEQDVAAMRVRQAGDTLFLTAPGRLPARLVRTASTGLWSLQQELIAAPPAYTVAASSFNAVLLNWDTKSDTTSIYYGVWAESPSGGRVKLFEKKVYAYTPWTAGAKIILAIQQKNVPAAALGHTWIFCKLSGGGYGRIWEREITAADIGSGTGWIDMLVDDNIVPNELVGRQINIREGDDAGGYALLDFHQQRQVLAGNANAPWSLWFSRLADLYAWTANRPSDDKDPFRATIPAVRASEIRHTVSGKRLLVFTTDGVYAVHSEGEGFSARTCQLEKVAPAGAGAAVPIDTGAAVLFLAEDDRTLLEMRYSFADDAHVAVDRSVLSRHLTAGAGVRAMSWQPRPDGILWLLLDDSTLLSFTFLPEHEVFGWSRHTILREDGETAELLDLCSTGSVLPVEQDGAEPGDPRWEATTALVILARGADGTPVLLRMRRSGAACGACMDFARSASPAEGESVTVPAGAAWRRDGGAWVTATEDTEVTGPAFVEWGSYVSAQLETLRPESPDRAAQGMRRRAVSCVVRTLASGSFTVADAAGGAATEESGDGSADAAHDVKLPPVTGWDWDGRIRIASAGPDRLEVLGIVTDIEFEGGR